MARFDFSKKADVEKLQKRIRHAYDRLSGGLGEADDCAQELLLGMLEGRHQHQTVDQAVIDYLRSKFGRKGSPGYIKRQNLERARHAEPDEFERILPRDIGRGLADGVDFERMLRGLNAIDKACFKLFFGWGLSEAEIGDLFSFSPTRACQRIERVSKRVRERTAQEAARQSQGQSFMEAVLRKETVGGWREVEYGADQSLAGEKSWEMGCIHEGSF